MAKTKALVKNDKNLDDFETAFSAIQDQAMVQLAEYRANMMEGAIKHIAAEAFQAGVMWATSRQLTAKDKAALHGG
jgi:hypothetical protein